MPKRRVVTTPFYASNARPKLRPLRANRSIIAFQPHHALGLAPHSRAAKHSIYRHGQQRTIVKIF
jgi:hypothetical protein